MTVNRLLKELEKAVANGKGRLPVLVFRRTFKDARDGDGLCFSHICAVSTRDYMLLDENGYSIHNDGREHWRSGVVLTGDNACPHGYEYEDDCSRCHHERNK